MINYKKIYCLFALENSKILKKKAQNRQIENTLRIRKT